MKSYYMFTQTNVLLSKAPTKEEISFLTFEDLFEIEKKIK